MLRQKALREAGEASRCIDSRGGTVAGEGAPRLVFKQGTLTSPAFSSFPGMWPLRAAPKGVPQQNPETDRFVSANLRSLWADARAPAPCSASLTPPPLVQLLHDPYMARTPRLSPPFLSRSPSPAHSSAATTLELNLYPSFLKTNTAGRRKGRQEIYLQLQSSRLGLLSI